MRATSCRRRASLCPARNTAVSTAASTSAVQPAISRVQLSIRIARYVVASGGSGASDARAAAPILARVVSGRQWLLRFAKFHRGRRLCGITPCENGSGEAYDGPLRVARRSRASSDEATPSRC
jgi:hypothetical protein